MATHNARSMREYLQKIREFTLTAAVKSIDPNETVDRVKRCLFYSIADTACRFNGYDERCRGLVGEISCPTLVIGNQSDSLAPEARRLYDALECPKDFLYFTEREGAGGHCERLGQSLFSQRAYDRLDEHVHA
jgi:hypothetical protein